MGVEFGSTIAGVFVAAGRTIVGDEAGILVAAGRAFFWAEAGEPSMIRST